MESAEVTIEIYRGNEMKAVRSGKGVYWIKFGTEKKKFQTGKVADPLGFPVWNTTAAIPVTASAKNIKLKGMDGDRCIGQLTIPLSQISRSKLEANAQQAALQPHRQCAHPTGSVSFLCYYTRFVEAPASRNGSTANLAAVGEQRRSSFGLMPPAMSGSVQSLSKRSGGGVLSKLKQAMTPLSGKGGSIKRKEGETDTLRASAKTMSFSTYDMRSMQSPKLPAGTRRSQKQAEEDQSDDEEWRLDLEGPAPQTVSQTSVSQSSHSPVPPRQTSAASETSPGNPFTSDLPPKAPNLRVSNSLKEASRPVPVVALPAPSPSRRAPVKSETEDSGGLVSLSSFRVPKQVERLTESGDKFQSMPHVRRRAQPAIIGDERLEMDDESSSSARPTAQSLAERLRNTRAAQQSIQSDSPSSVMTPPRSESTLLSSGNDGHGTPPSNVSSRQNSLSRDAMRRPQVIACEPTEGTIQGNTQLVIRGVNLGSSETDIVAVYVCGANCRNSLVFHSSTEIRCVTKSWRECTGFVVVETKTGGRSNSAVQFTYKDYTKVQMFPSPSPSPLLARRNDPTRSSMQSKASNDSGNLPSHPITAVSSPAPAPISAPLLVTTPAPTPVPVAVPAPAAVQTQTQAQAQNGSANGGVAQKAVSDVALEMASENTRLRQRLLEAEQSARKLQLDNTALKSYIDQLLERIIAKCPEILCVADDTTDKGKKRSM